jgi:hypothetical protein
MSNNDDTPPKPAKKPGRRWRRTSRILSVAFIPTELGGAQSDDEARLAEFTAEFGRLSARRPSQVNPGQFGQSGKRSPW